MAWRFRARKGFGAPADGARGKDRRRGAASLEFALIAPALLLFVMGLFEMSMLSYAKLTTQKAAQLASRYAATGQSQLDQDRKTRIVEIAQSFLPTLPGAQYQVFVRSWKGIDASGPGIQNDPGGPCDMVEVAIDYKYKPFMPLVAQVLPSVITLSEGDRRVNEPWQPCK